MPDVIVIGGGAAGMMASIAAAEQGAQVTLVERNEKLGRKLYITGKGRCNCTNDCTMDEFLREVPRNPRFLYSALTAFSPQDMMRFLEENGCPVVVQRGRRVFPQSEKASDVTRTLERVMRRLGVQTILNTRVQAVFTESQRVAGITTDQGQQIESNAVILTTGGKSYPGTGSTGDGYRMAEALQHTVLHPMPSLSAIETAASWPMKLQGLSLKNVRITLKKGKKTLYSEQGEMLFTHFGISGPIVLEMSCHMPEDWADLQVTLDLKPALTMDQLDARLLREIDGAPRRQLRNLMNSVLPEKMADVFPGICGIDETVTGAQITRVQRARIAATLKELPIELKRLRPIEEAIVTRGGVSTKEINPSTMESRLVQGLYVAGELLDVDAHTGGYNLHIAFSTGRLAGLSAARFCKGEAVH